MTPALLLGRDCTDKGVITHRGVGSWGVALCRGLDSPAPKQDPNEDACGVVTGAELSVAIVADAHFGARSAELAVMSLLSAARQQPPRPDQARDWLERQLSGINRRALPGSSACALIAVVLSGSTLSWLSVGDCRLYRVRAGKTVVLNPLRNHYLGDWQSLAMDSGEHALQQGDRVILASDGLPECRYNIPTLTPRQVGQIAPDSPPLQAAVALVEAALAGGGEDNIAVAVLHYS